VRISPESLGPVTVQAHIGSEGVTVHLYAPNDAGRDALRGILADLRRDLFSAGMNAGLALSDQNEPPADRQEQREQREERPERVQGRMPVPVPGLSAESAPTPRRTPFAIDVLA